MKNYDVIISLIIINNNVSELDHIYQLILNIKLKMNKYINY